MGGNVYSNEKEEGQGEEERACWGGVGVWVGNLGANCEVKIGILVGTKNCKKRERCSGRGGGGRAKVMIKGRWVTQNRCVRRRAGGGGGRCTFRTLSHSHVSWSNHQYCFYIC